jgi:hypothetical protein
MASSRSTSVDCDITMNLELLLCRQSIHISENASVSNDRQSKNRNTNCSILSSESFRIQTLTGFTLSGGGFVIVTALL